MTGGNPVESRSTFTRADMARHVARMSDWARPHRAALYRRVNLEGRKRILNVACGDGAMTAELAERTKGEVVGVDASGEMVRRARERYPRLKFREEDMHALSFRSGSFDLVVCNFGLFRARSPEMAVQEMARVLAKGGALLDTGEPDYAGRIDHPEALSGLGKLICDAMLRARANPNVGRKMRQLFSEAELKAETGIMSSVWDDEMLAREFKQEWVLISKMLLPIIGRERVEHLIATDKHAVESGSRVIFTPVFWCIGRKD